MLDGAEGDVVMLPERSSVTIGRSSKEADVRIDKPGISRVHARLTFGARTTLEDMGSSNGTRIGGVRLVPGQPVIVPPNASFELGGVVLVIHVGKAHSEADLASAPDGTPALARTISEVAASELAVLLVGETGVGKSWLARGIHDQSAHAGRSFVVVPCLELRDAYDSGLFERGRGGTIVLDEITDTPKDLQRDLVRTLDLLAGQARIVSTSRADVVAMSSELSPELYHRINGITVTVPPLRERVAEISDLAVALAARIADDRNRQAPVLAPDALRALERHAWPGNVRELAQVMERALTLCRGRVITASHLEGVEDANAGPVGVNVSRAGKALKEARDGAEYQRILEVLRVHHGNQTHAAKALGISRGTLISRLERYGMPRPFKR